MALPKVKERFEAGRGKKNVREGLAQTRLIKEGIAEEM